ncbi:MAG: type II toxin-antitoxin system HicB family antitoxin [Tepidisphaeraceae bacterium]|jgi:predicted RNase H-like HicB family nuclease
MKLSVVLEQSDEGGFTVYVPASPGCISEGDTRDEALANIREAIELYLVPDDDDGVPSSVGSVPLSPKAETVKLTL